MAAAAATTAQPRRAPTRANEKKQHPLKLPAPQPTPKHTPHHPNTINNTATTAIIIVTHTKQVDHPNCIKLYAVYITPRKVYIVTELVTGGELLDRVTERGNYTEKDAAGIIRQILSGVAYLHSKGQR